MYTYMDGQASGVPGPPRQWYGLVGWGGGAGVTRKPYASYRYTYHLHLLYMF